MLLLPSSKTPYLYNQNLSGKSIGTFDDPTATIVFYDPAPYPDGSRCVAYLDGHVETLTAEQWAKASAKAGIAAK
jgi:hypothetical protein